MKHIIIFLINIYQKILSPDQGLLSYLIPGKTCRHIPSCSEYAKQAVQKYGVIPGIKMGIRRVGKCRPGGTWGVDYP
jgi:hypothetical protein